MRVSFAESSAINFCSDQPFFIILRSGGFMRSPFATWLVCAHVCVCIHMNYLCSIPCSLLFLRLL